MYTQPGNPKVIMGGTATPETLSVPGVMVDNDVGRALRAELANAVTVNATLSATTFLEESMDGNIMADFSSRGPFPRSRAGSSRTSPRPACRSSPA